jgi:HEAT repeat protein
LICKQAEALNFHQSNMVQIPPDNRVGVFTLDADLCVQLWDAELERISGLSSEVVRHKPIIALFPDLETRGLVKYFHRVLTDNVVEVLAPAFHHYLIPCPPSTASQRFDKMQQRVTIAPLREGERTAGVIVSLEDVTERIDREQDLQEQLASPDELTRLQAAEVLAYGEVVGKQEPLLSVLSDESWRVRRAAVQGLSSRAAPDAIAALLESMRQDHYNLSLLNSALQVLALSDVDTLSPLVEFLRGEDGDLRMQAALALGEQRERRAIPDLISALNDSDVNVRYHAIEALGKLRANEAVELITNIAEQRDFFLSYVALDALGQIGDGSITPRIVPLLEDDLLSEAAADLLGKLGDEFTVEPLANLLNSSNVSPAVITRALATLYDRYQERYDEGQHIADLSRQFINSQGIQSLIAFLNEQPTEDLRSVALVMGWLEGTEIDQALTHLLGNAAARSEVVEALVRHGEGVTELLLEQLDAEELDTRTAAVIALGKIGDKRATPALIEVLREDERLIIATADSLSKIGDAQAFDPLLELIGSESAAVRQAAIGALNSLGAPQASERVKSLLDDENPYIRESAVRIAGYFGYRDCASQILDRCQDENEQVRSAAIESLPFFDDDRTVTRLTAALSSETPKVRAAAARAMAHIDKASAVSSLLEAIKDEDAWVRYFAARSLGSQKALEGISQLTQLVQLDKIKHVRIAALDALGQIGGEEAAAVAAAALDSGDKDLALPALAALGKNRHSNALPPLIAATRSPDVSIRTSALAALGVRGGDEVIAPLQWAAMNEDPAIFRKAITILGELATPEAIAGLIDLVADPLRREACIVALAKAHRVEQVATGLSHQNSDVRGGVVEALARMKRERASALLKNALQDNVASVRLAAASALGLRPRPLPESRKT